MPAGINAAPESIQFSDAVRIERGPARKRAIATTELLDDAVTARHYQVGAKDALGNPIKIGAHMDYLDWKGDYVWYVYKLDASGRYQPAGSDPNLEGAIAIARAL